MSTTRWHDRYGDSSQMWREPGSSRSIDRQGRLSHYFQSPCPLRRPFRPLYRHPLRASVAREIYKLQGPPEGQAGGCWGRINSINRSIGCRYPVVVFLVNGRDRRRRRGHPFDRARLAVLAVTRRCAPAVGFRLAVGAGGFVPNQTMIFRAIRSVSLRAVHRLSCSLTSLAPTPPSRPACLTRLWSLPSMED